MTFPELAKRVRTHLGQDHRYEHCVRVARLAENLARVHAQDTALARLAGMLHDLARLYSAERLLDEAQTRGIPIDSYARAHPVVLHAPLSARLANELFGVSDRAVLSAIEKHTLGDAEMTPLDCVVYLADSLEPGRRFSERAELTEIARRDLREGMRATIASSLRYLKQKHLEAAPQTAGAMRTFGVDPYSLEVGTAGTT